MLQDHYLSSDDLDDIHNTRSQSKGITQCDLGYIATFEPKDLKKLEIFADYIKFFREVGKLEQKNDLLEYYEQFLARQYQDQTVQYDVLPEPLHIGYKPDRVVFSGLERIADLVTGRNDLTFQFYAIGTDPSPVLPADTRLGFEQHRVSIGQTGFAESKGSSMVFAAAFPTTIASMQVTESGIFDRLQNPSTMFLRTVYTGANIVNHVFNQTFVATSHFVYQLSV